jgi:16S rRNA processing protein RimM
MLAIGQILKPQGLKGQFKVKPLTFDVGRFYELKEVTLKTKTQETTFSVSGVSLRNGFVYLSLGGINDLNSAESLRGGFLYVRREDAVKLPEGFHFVADLIGLRVYVDDEFLGTLREINQFGAADVYVVRDEKNRDISFPYLKDVVSGLDVGAGELRLHKKRFFEVAVFE